MKVAVNTRFLLKDRLEGVGIYTHEICKRMALKHPEVEFHFFFDRAYHDDFIYAPNVFPYVLFPPARHPILWTWWFDFSVYRKLKQIGADVFFSPDMFLSLRSECPVVLTSHDLSYIHYPDHVRSSHLKYFRRNFPSFHRRADRVICVSEYSRQDVIRQFDVEPEKVFTVYNAAGVQFEPLRDDEVAAFRAQWTRERPYFLFLGALQPRKNVKNLLLAYSQYRDRNPDGIPLVLAGRWAWKSEEIRKAFHSSPYPDDIVRIENPGNALRDLVGSAHAMVYLSHFEGFGLPVVESMSAGVPVLASDIDVHREVAGSAALLVDPDDLAVIVSGMESIASDHLLRKDLRARGLEQAARYNWDKSAEETFKHLREAALISDTNK